MKAWNTHLAHRIIDRDYETVLGLQMDVLRLIANYGCSGNLSCGGTGMINQGLICPLNTGVECKANYGEFKRNKRLCARYILNDLKQQSGAGRVMRNQ